MDISFFVGSQGRLREAREIALQCIPSREIRQRTLSTLGLGSGEQVYPGEMDERRATRKSADELVDDLARARAGLTRIREVLGPLPELNAIENAMSRSETSGALSELQRLWCTKRPPKGSKSWARRFRKQSGSGQSMIRLRATSTCWRQRRFSERTVPLQVLSETALAEAIDRARRENVQR